MQQRELAYKLRVNKIEESSIDWWNSSKAVVQHLSEKKLHFRVLPGIAEALAV